MINLTAWQHIVREAREWMWKREDLMAMRDQAPRNEWVDTFTTTLNEQAARIEYMGRKWSKSHTVPWEALGELCMSVHHTQQATQASHPAPPPAEARPLGIRRS